MAQKNQRVKVLRAFFSGGEIVGVDSVEDFPISQAAELQAAGKVEFVQADMKKASTKKPTARVNANADDGDKK